MLIVATYRARCGLSRGFLGTLKLHLKSYKKRQETFDNRVSGSVTPPLARRPAEHLLDTLFFSDIELQTYETGGGGFFGFFRILLSGVVEML